MIEHLSLNKGHFSDLRISASPKPNEDYTDIVDTLYGTSQAIQSKCLHGLLQLSFQFSHLVIWNPPLPLLSQL